MRGRAALWSLTRSCPSLKIPTTGSFPDKFHGESAVLDKILQALADNRAALADALGRVSGAPKTKSAIQGVLDILKRATPATFPAGDSPTHLSEHWKLWVRPASVSRCRPSATDQHS